MAGYNVIAYAAWVANWHHSKFSLNSFLVLSLDIAFETSMENFNDETKQCKFALYVIECFIQEDSTTENIFVAIS